MASSSHKLCLIILTQISRNFGSLNLLFQAETELQKVNSDIETGKLYFTGTGYTVNLIPHAIILGLLTFGKKFFIFSVETRNKLTRDDETGVNCNFRG